MNLLKRSSPNAPNPGNQSSIYSGRLTPSPHYTTGSTPGSPLTTHHRTTNNTTQGPQQQTSSLLLQMGGENSAFKALVPNAANLFTATTEDMRRRLGGYLTDSDEEINVNDESDVEDVQHIRSKSSSPVEVVDPPQAQQQNDTSTSCQPLQLTMHDRD